MAGSENRDFIFESGNLSLDLVNTRPLSAGQMIDRLTSVEEVDAWLAVAGVAERGSVLDLSARLRERVLVDARALRSAVAAAASALRDGVGVPDAAVDVVNGILATRSWTHRVERTADGFRRGESAAERDASAVLAPVAEAAAELLAEVDPARIRQCDDDTCVLWFVDTTRNGSRRWCSMERCGSRAKSAAHYRRTKKGRRRPRPKETTPRSASSTGSGGWEDGSRVGDRPGWPPRLDATPVHDGGGRRLSCARDRGERGGVQRGGGGPPASAPLRGPGSAAPRAGRERPERHARGAVAGRVRFLRPLGRRLRGHGGRSAGRARPLGGRGSRASGGRAGHGRLLRGARRRHGGRAGVRRGRAAGRRATGRGDLRATLAEPVRRRPDRGRHRCPTRRPGLPDRGCSAAGRALSGHGRRVDAPGPDPVRGGRAHERVPLRAGAGAGRRDARGGGCAGDARRRRVQGPASGVDRRPLRVELVA